MKNVGTLLYTAVQRWLHILQSVIILVMIGGCVFSSQSLFWLWFSFCLYKWHDEWNMFCLPFTL